MEWAGGENNCSNYQKQNPFHIDKCDYRNLFIENMLCICELIVLSLHFTKASVAENSCSIIQFFVVVFPLN